MTSFNIKNFLDLLNKSEKLNLWVLIFLLILSVFLEAMGIGMILPLISILIEPEIIISFFSQFEFFPKYVLDDRNLFLQIIVSFIVLVFTLKAIILTIFTKVYIKFGYSLQYSISKRLYWK